MSARRKKSMEGDSWFMDSTFTCISSEELLVVEGGKIKTEDVCYWVGAGVGFGYSCLKLLLGY